MRWLLAALSLVLVAAPHPASSDTSSAGNDYYGVFVEDQPGAHGVGAFTISTGPAHPAGDGKPVLFSRSASGDAGTSWLTVRSYSTGTDYVQTTSAPASGNLVRTLDVYGGVGEVPGGYEATYGLPGPTATPERLTITSAVRAEGSGSATRVLLDAQVTNEDEAPLEIGVRYLLDFDPGGDDGPALTWGGEAEQQTAESVRSAFASARLVGDGMTVDVSTEGQQADMAVLAYWPFASEQAFDYAPDGSRDVATDGGLNDGALLLYFGTTRETSLRLAPGDTASVRVVIRADGSAELCSNGVDDDGDRLIDAQDSDCASPSPTPVPSAQPVATATPGPNPVITPAALPRTGSRLEPNP